MVVVKSEEVVAKRTGLRPRNNVKSSLIKDTEEKVEEEKGEDSEEIKDENHDEEEQGIAEDEEVVEELVEGEEEAGADIQEAEEEDDGSDNDHVAEGEEQEQENSESTEEEETDDDEFDVEKELKRKVKLNDGSESFAYSRGPEYPNGLWPINCHLCRIGNIITDVRFMSHTRSKRHIRNLNRVKLPEEMAACFYQEPNERLGINTPIKIYAGEFIEELGEKYKHRILKEEELRRATEKEILPNTKKQIEKEPIHEYNKTAPIIGLSYGFAVNMPGKRKILYYCALCNKNIMTGEPYQHFVGADHQFKYIVKHFPKMFKKARKILADLKNFHLEKKHFGNIFRCLYRKIENEKGLRKITFCTVNSYTHFQRKYITALDTLNHYNEDNINFTHDELMDLVRKSMSGITFIKPDLISLRKAGIGLRADVNTLSRSIKKRKRKPSPEREMTLPSAPKSEMPPASTRSRRDAPPPPPAIRASTSQPPIKSGDKNICNDVTPDWTKFHLMNCRVIFELEKLYKQYEKIPESHPNHNKEWRQYKGRRFEELKRENIDPRYYDMDKEWIPHWLGRLRELYAEDLLRRKYEIKITCGIPDGRRFSPARKTKKAGNIPAPPPASNSNRYDRNRNMEDDVLEPSEPLTVISVIRLLTALEDQLGSLGPQAVELLSTAILFEKNHENPNELLLENNDFYVFFMTANEKLKGQLLANLVESRKIPAVKNAVSDLKNILRKFEEHMGRRQGSNREKGMGEDVGSSHQSGNFGRKDINEYNDKNRQNNGNNRFDLGSRNNQYGSNIGSGNQTIPMNYNSNQHGIWQQGGYNLSSSSNSRGNMSYGSSSESGHRKFNQNLSSSFSDNKSGGAFDNYNSSNFRGTSMQMDWSSSTSRNLPSLPSSSLDDRFGFIGSGNNRSNFGMNRSNDFGRSSGRY